MSGVLPPLPPPTRAQLLRGIELAHQRLLEIGGRWQDSIPPETRAELLRVTRILSRLLARSGRLRARRK